MVTIYIGHFSSVARTFMAETDIYYKIYVKM